MDGATEGPGPANNLSAIRAQAEQLCASVQSEYDKLVVAGAELETTRQEQARAATTEASEIAKQRQQGLDAVSAERAKGLVEQRVALEVDLQRRSLAAELEGHRRLIDETEAIRQRHYLDRIRKSGDM